MDVDRRRLFDHVEKICATPRPAESDALRAARDYVRGCLEEFGWYVEPERFRMTDDLGAQLTGINLVAAHREHPLSGGPRFLVGAHLDSRPDSPGADDNGSAVATLLEIARVLPPIWPADPRLELQLVVFDLEENGMLGGAYQATRANDLGIDLRGMVSLEMLGYCDHAPQSQNLPRQLVGLYPDTGDFIAIIGNQNSVALIDSFRDGMQQAPGLPVETLCVPQNGELLQATRLSDHSPFWDAGFAALMITDTSFLRNPHYHLPSDTIDTLDFDFLHHVAIGCAQATRNIIANGL